MKNREHQLESKFSSPKTTVNPKIPHYCNSCPNNRHYRGHVYILPCYFPINGAAGTRRRDWECSQEMPQGTKDCIRRSSYTALENPTTVTKSEQSKISLTKEPEVCKFKSLRIYDSSKNHNILQSYAISCNVGVTYTTFKDQLDTRSSKTWVRFVANFF